MLSLRKDVLCGQEIQKEPFIDMMGSFARYSPWATKTMIMVHYSETYLLTKIIGIPWHLFLILECYCSIPGVKK